MASNMGAQKARAMKSGSGAFDIDDFVSKLVMFMGGQKSLEDALPDDSDPEDTNDNSSTLDWDRIGRKAIAKSRRVPTMGFMYLPPLFYAHCCTNIAYRLGPLSIEQKKRAATKRSKLEKNKEDERKPQELKEEDITRSQNETTKNVAIVS
jgi:non-structural maintenance of chromosomes element 4